MTHTQTPPTAGFILSEANGKLSRDQAVFAPSATEILAGTVVAQLTTGEWVPYAPPDELGEGGEGDDEGAGIAKGVLFASLPASDTDQPGTVMTRLCEVSRPDLIGLDAAAEAALLGNVVIVR